MTRDQVKAIFPNAADEAISAFLNLHNSEKQGAVKNAQTLNDETLSKAQETESLKGTVETLQATVDQLTAQNKAAKTQANALSAQNGLVRAGMSEELAKMIAGKIATDSEEETINAINELVNAYSAQETARKQAEAQERADRMLTPNLGGTKVDPAIAIAQRLGQETNTKNQSSLSDFT